MKGTCERRLPVHRPCRSARPASCEHRGDDAINVSACKRVPTRCHRLNPLCLVTEGNAYGTWKKYAPSLYATRVSHDHPRIPLQDYHVQVWSGRELSTRRCRQIPSASVCIRSRVRGVQGNYHRHRSRQSVKRMYDGYKTYRIVCILGSVQSCQAVMVGSGSPRLSSKPASISIALLA